MAARCPECEERVTVYRTMAECFGCGYFTRLGVVVEDEGDL